jgi:hypothetical protein
MFKRVWLVLAAVASLSFGSSAWAQDGATAASPTPFERLLFEARAGRQGMSEVWPAFLDTTVLVAVQKLDADDVGFILFPSMKDRERKTVLISEHAHRLERVSERALRMTGAKLVRALKSPETEITLALSDGSAFRIPAEVVRSLRTTLLSDER